MRKHPQFSTLHMVLASSLAMAALLGMKSTQMVREFLVPPAQAESATQPTPTPAPTVAPTPDAAPAALPVSDEEQKLLQDLRQRKQTLDARAQSLDTREAALAAAEASLTTRIQDLKNLQDNLQKLQDAATQRDDANWQGLVSVYETMKPAAAAAILNNLDMPVVLQIFNRMKDRKAALILSEMDTDRARLVTVQLAKLRAAQNPQIASNS